MVDDHAFDRHADFQYGREVFDTVERYLGYVKQSRHAPDLHESTVGLDSLDLAAREQETRRSHYVTPNQQGLAGQSSSEDSLESDVHLVDK